MDGRMEQDLAQPMWVVERHCGGFRLVQRHQDTAKLTERAERRAQGEAEIDGLLTDVTPIREKLEGTKRLLEVSCGLTVG